jgi:hypothetical protein
MTCANVSYCIRANIRTHASKLNHHILKMVYHTPTFTFTKLKSILKKLLKSASVCFLKADHVKWWSTNKITKRCNIRQNGILCSFPVARKHAPNLLVQSHTAILCQYILRITACVSVTMPRIEAQN